MQPRFKRHASTSYYFEASKSVFM